MAFSNSTESVCSAASTSADALWSATTARSTAVVLRKPWKIDWTHEAPQRKTQSGSLHEREAESDSDG